MRRWIGCLTLIVVGVLLLGSATVALASTQPLQPGGLGFALQTRLEEIHLQRMTTPEAKARYAIQIFQRRAYDLQALSGTAREATALPYLNYALDQALLALSEVPAEQSAPLWGQLTQAASQARVAVANAPLTGQMYPQVTRALMDKLDTLLTVAQKSPSPDALVRVVGITIPFPPILSALAPQLAQQDQATGMVPASKFKAMHTFFPLIGQHALLQCEQCHLNGQYVGTHDACEACHAKDKPEPHFAGRCDLCHTPTSWQEAHFDHTVAAAADCAACHTKDKPANHFQGQCSLCHTTTAWLPAHFNHATAAATDCAACHTKDKPANHFQGQCSLCHTTTAWLPAHFNHAAAAATDCAACHTKDKPANHFQGQCSLCHTTTAWRPAHFNHQAVGATNCVACHTKDKPANHFQGQCSQCHSTTAWLPANFNHTLFPINHGGANGQCSVCHPSGYTSYTCYQCHNQAKMQAKHNKKGISNIAGRCIACHAGGGDGDDDGGGDDDDDDDDD